MKRLRPRGFRSEHTGREREITGNNREAERERGRKGYGGNISRLPRSERIKTPLEKKKGGRGGPANLSAALLSGFLTHSPDN